MTYTNCKKCSQEIPRNQTACPNCGAKNPIAKIANFLLGLTVIVMVLAIIAAPDKGMSDQELESAQVTAWYQGGNLHDQTGLDWQLATYENKLATSAELLSELMEQDILKEDIRQNLNSMDAMKLLSETLVKNLDAVFK